MERSDLEINGLLKISKLSNLSEFDSFLQLYLSLLCNNFMSPKILL